MIPKTNAIASFNSDEKGVSPVIGVILMVAITVILAAVIGSFVLGIGSDISETPQASIEFNPQDDKIIHQGGDTLNSNYIEITEDVQYTPSADTTFEAGDDLLEGTTPGFTEDSTIRVVWSAPGSDKTSVIASYNA